MARRDIFHGAVRRALEKDGWTITHDPFNLSFRKRDLFIDLGAERLINAEKGLQKIVVEVKSFVGRSAVRDLQRAVGQYAIYQRMLRKAGFSRKLYLAVPREAFANIFQDDLGELLLEDGFMHVIVFDKDKEEIIQWIPR